MVEHVREQVSEGAGQCGKGCEGSEGESINESVSAESFRHIQSHVHMQRLETLCQQALSDAAHTE